MKKLNYDYLMIGSGISGLSAAKKLAGLGTTCVISKSYLKECATNYAQGGIAAALSSDDTPKIHKADTIKAGGGLCNEEAVSILVEEGVERVQDLISIGASFDKIGAKYDFTKEGAHTKQRVLHAGDETGKEIERSIASAVQKEQKVDFLENTTVVRLLVKDNICFGCLAIHNKEKILIYAKAVILAAGGCGQIYSRNTNPTIATGDGISLAFYAGAEVQDMEFIQFHPTTLHLGDKKPISIFLISEAIRGEGAILRNINGERFMAKYHPKLELAPRDIVARSIYNEIQITNSQHVFLDLVGIRKNIAKRFPAIYKRCLEAKIDISRDFIPVAPAAHYLMGGIKADSFGRTSVKRLYAAGETAALGIHGANRLASNSLLDGLVFGHRAALDASSLSAQNTALSDTDLKEFLYEEEITVEKRTSFLALKQIIRDTMWHNVGIKRDRSSLLKAIKIFEEYSWIKKINTLEIDLFEVQNMLVVSELVTRFALEREESRGAHYRRDFPKSNDKDWKKHISYNRDTLNIL
jgi:L-aspartate oxidase